VCKFLYLIIFVPYNLFRLFLVHKISAYKYIYENGEKKWEKKKRKEFPASWAGGGGDFGPPGASARGGVLVAQLAQPRGSDGGGRRRGAGPHAREKEGLTALTARRNGGGSTGFRSVASPAAVLRCGSGSSAGKRWRSTGG
jgi:hypothetical protein